VGGGGDGRVHNDRKRASRCSLSVVVKWRVVVWQGDGFTTIRTFSTAAEGGGARGQPPPSKMSTHARLRQWEKVVVLEDNHHRRKRAFMLVFEGGERWCWCRCWLYSAKFASKLAGEVGVIALRVGTTLENERTLRSWW
jgi:hypothetical protein